MPVPPEAHGEHRATLDSSWHVVPVAVSGRKQSTIGLHARQLAGKGCEKASGMPLPGCSITVPLSRLHRWYVAAPAAAVMFAPRQYCQSSVTQTPPTSDIVDVASMAIPASDVMHGTVALLVILLATSATHELPAALMSAPNTIGANAVKLLPCSSNALEEETLTVDVLNDSPWPDMLENLLDDAVSSELVLSDSAELCSSHPLPPSDGLVEAKSLEASSSSEYRSTTIAEAANRSAWDVALILTLTIANFPVSLRVSVDS